MLLGKEDFKKAKQHKGYFGWHTTKKMMIVLSTISTPMVVAGSAIMLFLMIVVTVVVSPTTADKLNLCTHKKGAPHTSLDS